MSIRLSKKHGVNPTIATCFYCGEPTGEIALLGKLPNDEKAPHYMTLNYTPCDSCKEKMAQGTTVIEVSTDTDGRPAITKDITDTPAYPTGRWCVITKEAAFRIFGIDNHTVCIDQELYNKIIGTIEE